jgi:hypothetical protein
MVNMNASKKARYTASITNRPQGGGDKKAGFPYQVGRISWSEVAIGTCQPGVPTACCTLSQIMKTVNPNVRVSRPIGRNIGLSYWNIPGTGK